jgi:hypothetical protein
MRGPNKLPTKGKTPGHTCATCEHIGPGKSWERRTCTEVSTGTRAGYAACRSYSKGRRARVAYDLSGEGRRWERSELAGAKSLRGETEGGTYTVPTELAPKRCLRCDKPFRRPVGSGDHLCESCHRVNANAVDTTRYHVIRP